MCCGCDVVVDVSVDVGAVWMWFEMWVWRGSGGGCVDVVLDVVLDVGVFVDVMMEMEVDFHGSVSIMKRQSQHKTTGQSLWRVLLSTRSELHSHPLAEQAQAYGRLTKADGPEGPMAPIVTTGDSSWEKLHFSRVILALGTMLIFSGSLNGKKNLKLCVSSLCGGHANLLRKGFFLCLPCAGAIQKKITVSFKPTTTHLELCVSSLCWGHAISVV